jgi:hypothetical protein
LLSAPTARRPSGIVPRALEAPLDAPQNHSRRPHHHARTFGYARVSTDGQAEDGQSLEVQERQIEGWAMQRGVTLGAVHGEAGVSGAVPFDERPEGGRLWAAL